MGVDQPRHDDTATGINRGRGLGRWRRASGADGGDSIILDEDVQDAGFVVRHHASMFPFDGDHRGRQSSALDTPNRTPILRAVARDPHVETGRPDLAERARNRVLIQGGIVLTDTIE